MTALRRFASLAALALACCARAPGEANFSFTWEDSAPSLPSDVFLTARLESNGAVLQEAPSQRFSMDSTLAFESVPSDIELTLIAELRDGPYTNSAALYYGISDPFTLHANEHLELTTVLRRGPPPFEQHAGPSPPDLEKLTLVRTPASTKLVGEKGAVPSGGLLVFSAGEVAEAVELGRVTDNNGARFELELENRQAPDRVYVAVLGADNALSDASPAPGIQASLVQKISLTLVPNATLDRIYRTALANEARDPPSHVREPASDSDVDAFGQSEADRLGAVALPVWHPHPDGDISPPARFGAASAADTTRGQVLLFGGRDAHDFSDTWVHDGDRWRDRTPVGGPGPRSGSAMAYDSARDRAVLFGGDAEGEVLDELWEWDGVRWHQVAPPASEARPSARRNHALAYDRVHARVVLFGGETAGGARFDDTWTWDGAHWSPIASGGPGARAGCAMAYDRANERVILFGGESDAGLEQDTWSLDGDTWSARIGTASPPDARRDAALAFDSRHGRMMLAGGHDALGSRDDLWFLDGDEWSRSAAVLPAPRSDLMLEYSECLQSLIFFGGEYFGTFGETLRWDGERLVDRTPTLSPPPSPRYGQGMAYDPDRDEVIIAGGFSEVTGPTRSMWAWDEQGWHSLGDTPDDWFGDQLAYDTQRRVLVLFGNIPSELWERNEDGQWGPTVLPPEVEDRAQPTLAYDEARHELVIFGGVDGPETTWGWNGFNFLPLSGPNRPSPVPRRENAMTYDPISRRVVLFGGRAFDHDPTQALPVYGDLWYWSGGQWAPLFEGPIYRYGVGLAYDRANERLLVQGGAGVEENEVTIVTPKDQLHVLRGSRWELLKTIGAHPSERVSHGMVYDARRERMVIFGGWDTVNSDSVMNDIWTLDMPNRQTPALDAVFDVGARVNSRLRVEELEVSANAGGVGCPDGGAELGSGALLAAWDRTRGSFVELASTETSNEDATSLSFTRTVDADHFVDARGKLYLRFAPRFGGGKNAANAEVRAGAISLRVLLRIEP